MNIQTEHIAPDDKGEDFWNDLPEYVKAGIERSRKQAEAGMLTPHDEVMKKYAKYLESSRAPI